MTINTDWIKERLDRGTCEVTGLPFTLNVGVEYSKQCNAQPYSPTLDRKDRTQGYTPENTQVVVAIYNYAKMHWSHDDVIVLAKAVLHEM